MFDGLRTIGLQSPIFPVKTDMVVADHAVLVSPMDVVKKSGAEPGQLKQEKSR
jgi:hypothetical protein